MLNKKGLLVIFTVSTVLLTACAADQTKTDTSGQEMELPDVIKIGFIAPLTGNAASLGQDSKSGVEYYFEKNKTIDGRKVEVIYEDGKCNGQDAANAAQKLINVDKVQVIIGGLCSGETLAIAPIAEQNKVVTLSAGSSSSEVTTAGDYIFRVYPSDSKVAQTMVEDIAKSYSKVAILSEQTDFAQGYRAAIKKIVESMDGLDVVIDESYAVDNSDFRTLLTKVKESEADTLITLGNSPAVNGFTVKQAAELGLDIQIYGPDAIAGEDFFNIAKNAAEGVKQAVVAEDPGREGFVDFVAGAKPAQSAVVFQTLAYDAAEIVAQAIEEVGYNGTKIKDYFYAMPTFNGIAGDHKFDENGDNLVPAAIKIAKDGAFVIMPADSMEKEGSEE